MSPPPTCTLLNKWTCAIKSIHRKSIYGFRVLNDIDASSARIGESMQMRHILIVPHKA